MNDITYRVRQTLDGDRADEEMLSAAAISDIWPEIGALLEGDCGHAWTTLDLTYGDLRIQIAPDFAGASPPALEPEDQSDLLVALHHLPDRFSHRDS